MSIMKFALWLMIGLPLGATQTARAAEPRAPEQVHMALRILVSVYADMNSKLKNQQFDRLPHENEEFKEGSGAMRDAIADEPPDFKSKVQDSLEKTLAAAQQVADLSKTHDEPRVKSAIDALASSMRTLNAMFPETLRAEPGSVSAPKHGGTGAT